MTDSMAEQAEWCDPRYETAYELGQRTGRTDSVVCTDCGAFVMDMTAHNRFHAQIPARGRAPKTAGVTVCSACLTEACWQGTLMCDEARSAGTAVRG